MTCTTCGNYTWNVFGRPHVCPPKWLVVNDDWDWSDAITVYAIDSETAAEKAAEMMDDNNGEGASEHSFLVKRDGTDSEEAFEVSFDYSVDYRAYKKDSGQ